MTDQLHLSGVLRLPRDAVTQTIALLGKRRAGKSYTLAAFVEELCAAGEQVVILDPKGDWWGLRTSADGKGTGLAVLIIGGEHQDLPLDPSAGEEIARVIVQDLLTVLLDLSELRKHQVATFCAEFLEQFYRLKAREEFFTR